MQIMKAVMISTQCVLGGIASFYVFAIAFTHAATVANFVAPCIAATAGAAISSFFWAYGLRTPIALPALTYSSAFWLLAIFMCAGAFSNLIFFGPLAASVLMFGLIGAWLGRKGRAFEQTSQN